jgi:hypothetical protein
MCKAYFKAKKEKVDLPATYFMHPFLVRNYKIVQKQWKF